MRRRFPRPGRGSTSPGTSSPGRLRPRGAGGAPAAVLTRLPSPFETVDARRAVEKRRNAEKRGMGAREEMGAAASRGRRRWWGHEAERATEGRQSGWGCGSEGATEGRQSGWGCGSEGAAGGGQSARGPRFFFLSSLLSSFCRHVRCKSRHWACGIERAVREKKPNGRGRKAGKWAAAEGGGKAGAGGVAEGRGDVGCEPRGAGESVWEAFCGGWVLIVAGCGAEKERRKRTLCALRARAWPR